ncbi:UBX domain-containing protein [Zalerion maritima]|uniref:UBX domain-containing protein n=1 Tax=Zalerion maritima TaxID=339359 RepID=A0AAD5RQM4_9PEZI|nr:UBX domain-containing protein [Zalerion maritima]
MSSNVTIITSDLKRAVVKATPGTYLADVLQQACKKLGLNNDNYQLKHGQKVVDLSIQFRLSGLSAGARLDLVYKSKTASVISLTLQLPSGERIPSQFPSNFSIWQILRQYESGKAGEGRNLEITQRGYPVITQGGGRGQLLHEMPVVTVVQRELRELEDFKKTLSQLGFNTGPILVRLDFRKTSFPLHEAMGKVEAMFADQEGTISADISKPEPAHSKPNASQEPTPDQAKQQNQPSQPMSPSTVQQQAPESSSSVPAPPRPAHHQSEHDLISFDTPNSQAGPSGSAPTISVDSLAPTHVFAAPSNNTPAAARLKFNEDNYTPTVEHAVAYQHRLQGTGQNKRLLSDQELEQKAAAKNARLNQVKSVDIRVRFPDNTSVDWTMGPDATGARVYEAVRSVMTKPSTKFHLALLPNQRIKDSSGTDKDLLIKGYELKGRVLLNIVLENNGTPGSARRTSFLKPEYAKKAEQVAVPEIPDLRDDSEDKESLGNMFKNLGANMSKEAGSAAKKLPKWFKTGKK